MTANPYSLNREWPEEIDYEGLFARAIRLADLAGELMRQNFRDAVAVELQSVRDRAFIAGVESAQKEVKP